MIGDQIRALREKAGYSRSELARRLSVTRTSVNAWESGLSDGESIKRPVSPTDTGSTGHSA